MKTNPESVKRIMQEIKPAKLVAATKYVDVKEIEELEKLENSIFDWTDNVKELLKDEA